MKILGADFIRWYDHGFPEGYYWDSDEDYIHDPDGAWKLDPAKTYKTDELGYLVPNDGLPEIDTDATIRAWLKAQSTTTLLVLVDKSAEETARAAIAGLGYKIGN